MNSDPRQAWSEIIIDHGQFPRKHGELESATHSGRGENPFCGDRVRLQLRIDEDGIIEDVRFQATGCAISTASGSMLAAQVAGQGVAEAEALFQAVHDLLTGEEQPANTDIGELEALQLVRQYPARVKCATLAWHVLRHALKGDREPATTE